MSEQLAQQIRAELKEFDNPDLPVVLLVRGIVERIAELEEMAAEIAAMREYGDVQAATIRTLREQVADLQETKDILYADNVRLIEQVAARTRAGLDRSWDGEEK